MSKLFTLKKWLTIGDTVRHLSAVFEENVSEADFYQLVLDGILRLSVRFVNEVPAKRVNGIPKLEGRTLAETGKGASISDATATVRKAYDRPRLETEEDVVWLNDVWDLPLFGSEWSDVNMAYHSLTGGPQLRRSSSAGAYVCSEEGGWYQLQMHAPIQVHSRDTNPADQIVPSQISWEEILQYCALSRELGIQVPEHFNPYSHQYCPSHLPDDAMFVVRASALSDLVRKLDENQANDLGTRTEISGWQGFDPDDEKYPEELDIALQAWRAVRNNPTQAPAKVKLTEWLRQSGYELSTNAITRIATVCNWEKEGGRPKAI